MNIRKIKLALAVGLLNNHGQSNVFQTIRDMLSTFQDAGAFIGQGLVGKTVLTPAVVQQTYALRFEHCTVNVELISNPHTNSQYVQGFNLYGDS